MLEPAINYIPENVKLTDFRYQFRQIKGKLLKEKRVLLLVERSKQIALLVPIDLIGAKPQLPINEKPKEEMPWPAFHLGKISIPLNRKNIYEAF